MGMFKQKVKVINSKDPKRFFEEDFWVDTGALYSLVPEDYLEKIGIEPVVKRNLMHADGRRDTRLLGFCDFQIEGLEGRIPCPVIFAPKGSFFLLGATALENFGVYADPIQKKLKPILAIIGGCNPLNPSPERGTDQLKKKQALTPGPSCAGDTYINR